MDDVALVEALRSGDQQAPRLLIERYQGVVFGLCYRMLNHQQDAEDVVQETFIRALRAMAGFDPARPICPLASRDRRQPLPHGAGRRARKPMLALADPAEELADPRGGLADPDDLAGELERALEGLRPEYRLVFVLFHSQHLSYDEIALVVTRPGRHRQNLVASRAGPVSRTTQSTRDHTMNCRDFERIWNELFDASSSPFVRRRHARAGR